MLGITRLDITQHLLLSQMGTLGLHALTPPVMAAISLWLLAGDQVGHGSCQPPPKGLLSASRVVGAAGGAR